MKPGQEKEGATAEDLAYAICRELGGNVRVGDRYMGRGRRTRAIVSEAMTFLGENITELAHLLPELPDD